MERIQYTTHTHRHTQPNSYTRTTGVWQSLASATFRRRSYKRKILFTSLHVFYAFKFSSAALSHTLALDNRSIKKIAEGRRMPSSPSTLLLSFRNSAAVQHNSPFRVTRVCVSSWLSPMLVKCDCSQRALRSLLWTCGSAIDRFPKTNDYSGIGCRTICFCAIVSPYREAMHVIGVQNVGIITFPIRTDRPFSRVHAGRSCISRI